MLEHNNLFYLLLSFLPALIFAIIVFISMPAYTIRWKVGSLFFAMGILSTFLVNAIHFSFPNWNKIESQNEFVAFFISAFIKIALLEEFCKLILFQTTEWYRNKFFYTDNPAAVMFYCMSVSCGFAVSENILYAQQYGGDVLFIRTFTSVIVHMICGLMMGYFIGLKNIKTNNFISTIGNINYKMIFLSICGLAASTFYHGLYDFNIFINGEAGNDKSIHIIIAGLLITFGMASKHFKKSV